MYNELQFKYVDPGRPMFPFGDRGVGDAGFDLYNAGPEIELHPGCHVSVPTNVSVKIPDGYVGLILARSSTFTKLQVFVVQGVIDSGYTGELFTIAWHPGLTHSRPTKINPGDRISQLVVVPYFYGSVREVKELPITNRGSAGFGSTGS